MLHKIIQTTPNKSILLIRWMVGLVFLSEGIQKFLFPEKLGAGRFAEIGLPYADFLGNFVGAFEIVCGIFILIGLLTRLASIPLIIIMLTAISSTKSEIFAEKGFWEMMHGSRTDWSMLLGSIFLFINGSGRYALDAYIEQNFFKRK